MKDIFFHISEFFKDWIYPGQYLKNLLFRRYDLVRMKNLSKYEYCDTSERILQANMQLIVDFIEKENPLDHVQWYGDEGPKYLKENGMTTYPEYDGQYIIDIVNEIYHWWKYDLPELKKDCEYLSKFHYTYLMGKMKTRQIDKEYDEIYFDKSNCPHTIDFFTNKDVNWKILDKYLENDRYNSLNERFIRNVINDIEKRIENETQKYLHLCIDIRYQLWT